MSKRMLGLILISGIIIMILIMAILFKDKLLSQLLRIWEMNLEVD